jgi:hypothetical protein
LGENEFWRTCFFSLLWCKRNLLLCVASSSSFTFLMLRLKQLSFKVSIHYEFSLYAIDIQQQQAHRNNNEDCKLCVSTSFHQHFIDSFSLYVSFNWAQYIKLQLSSCTHTSLFIIFIVLFCSYVFEGEEGTKAKCKIKWKVEWTRAHEK